jgi:hypothetical protein
MTKPRVWWRARAGEVHKVATTVVRDIEERQHETFDRFLMLEALYDPRSPAAELADPKWKKNLDRITENVIASAIDTVAAGVSTADIRPRFMTDGADWSTQRRAKRLGLYAEELKKKQKIIPKCRKGFFGAAKKGMGCNKVYADRNNRLRIEPVPIDNVVVDDIQCLNGGSPRELHLRMADYDRDELIQQFPDHRDAIERARSREDARMYMHARLARWQQSETRSDLVVFESWRLPMGVKPDDWDDLSEKERRISGYVPGRHVIYTDGLDLLDEEYHKPHFPLAFLTWSEREGSFYGISLAERLQGHQKTINKRGWHADRLLDRMALPTTFVHISDQNLQAKTTEIGNIVAYRGAIPKTEVPAVVGAEVQQHLIYAKNSAFEEAGVSRMGATGNKPGGDLSGVAMRELRDVASARFALQEVAFEHFVLETIMLALDVCKDLGEDAPTMSRQTRFGPQAIEWDDVVIEDLEVQIAAAATLNRTPSGRLQTVLEFAQAGIFSLDDARRLVQHPDLEQALSQYTAAVEAIEADLEDVEEGNFVAPEPLLNLKLARDRGTSRYLIDRKSGAPEDILEGLRTYVVQAAHLLKLAEAAAANSNALPPGGAIAGPPPVTPQQVPAAGPPLSPAATAA